MSQRPEIEQPLDVDAEYRAIEGALLETARGRWFLAEHSKRSRRLESVQLEAALDQLKSSMRDPPALVGQLRAELENIQDLLDKAKADLMAREGIDARQADGLHAPSAILDAAEQLHAHAWSLQAQEIDTEVCEKIGLQTARIFALSARQAQESQRAKRQAETLDEISDRITGIIRSIILEIGGAEATAPTTDRAD